MEKLLQDLPLARFAVDRFAQLRAEPTWLERLWAAPTTRVLIIREGTLPATALEDFPHVGIGNGLITAQVYPPGEKRLYQGTRFDHAGVVFHVTYKGQDFSTYWFDRFVIDPSDEVCPECGD